MLFCLCAGSFLFGHENGLRLPASAAALALHPAGRCPSLGSLLPPLAAVASAASHSIARPIALTGNRVPPQRTVLRETSCTREEQRQGLAVILVLHKARLCVWINLLDMI